MLELGFEIATRGVPSVPTWQGLLAPPTPSYQVCSLLRLKQIDNCNVVYRLCRV